MLDNDRAWLHPVPAPASPARFASPASGWATRSFAAPMTTPLPSVETNRFSNDGNDVFVGPRADFHHHPNLSILSVLDTPNDGNDENDVNSSKTF